MSCDNGHTATRIKTAVENATGRTLPSSIVCNALNKDGSRHSPAPLSRMEAEAAVARMIRDLNVNPDHPDLIALQEDVASGRLKVTSKHALVMTSNIPAHVYEQHAQAANRRLADPVIPHDPELRRVTDAILDAGGRPYLVGGAVRDMILGHNPKDLDVEVFGLTPEQLEDALSTAGKVDLVGKAFGVYKIGNVDIALPRTETKTGSGHQGFDVTPDGSLPVDVAAQRRDFTINAISVDLNTGALVDPTGGVHDLRTGTLKHVGPAFAEDPLRVLRGMQFCARFGLTPHPDTVRISRMLLAEQRTLAAERVSEEWDKFITKGVQHRHGLDFAYAAGWLPEPLSELRTASSGDNLGRAGEALERIAQSTSDRAARRNASWAALTIDVPDEQAHTLIRELAPDKASGNSAWATRRITQAIESGRVDDADLRRLAEGPVPLSTALRVASSRADSPNRDLETRIEQLGIMNGPLPVLLTGNDVINAGWRPGPELGAVLKTIRSRQLDGELNSREDAIQFLAAIKR